MKHLSQVCLVFCSMFHILTFFCFARLDNVLLKIDHSTESLVAAKLADFGLSHVVDGRSQIYSAVGGTNGYKAPEVLEDSRRATHKADVWACGITLRYVWYQRHPFMEDGLFMNDVRIFNKLRDTPGYLKISEKLMPDAALRAAVDSMLVLDAGQRASASVLAKELVCSPPATSRMVSVCMWQLCSLVVWVCVATLGSDVLL